VGPIKGLPQVLPQYRALVHWTFSYLISLFGDASNYSQASNAESSPSIVNEKAIMHKVITCHAHGVLQEYLNMAPTPRNYCLLISIAIGIFGGT
jgi:hypothetical protein